MTRLVVNRVLCDGGPRPDGRLCINSIGAVDRHQPMSEIRRDARHNGWARKDGRDLCPFCSGARPWPASIPARLVDVPTGGRL